MKTMQASDVVRLKRWLEERGAEILGPTNPYEALRFQTDAVGVIYKNRRGEISYLNDEAKRIWTLFATGGHWKGVETPKRPGTKYKNSLRRKLEQRYGNRCIYCTGLLGDCSEAIIEHILPRAVGGPDHISNYGLACKECETAVGTMSLVEKIRFAQSKVKGTL